MIRFKAKKLFKYVMTGALITCQVLSLAVVQGTVSTAAPIDELRAELAKTRDELNSLTSREMAIEGQKDAVEEEIAQLDENLIQLMSSIDLLQEEIVDKKLEVEDASDSLDKAREKEESQYKAMKIRIRFMYEHGDYNYVQLLLEAGSLSDLMNKADYIERLYSYDRQLLLEYQEIVKEVALLKERLEEEQAALEAEEFELEEEQDALEGLLNEKRSQVDDFDAQIASLRSVSNKYSALIRQQTSQIQAIEREEAARREAERKAREEAERKAREEADRKAQEEKDRLKKDQEAAGGGTQSGGQEDKKDSSSNSDNNSTDSSQTNSTSQDSSSDSGSSGGRGLTASEAQVVSMIGSASGSGKGKQIAAFGCQFIGNPYVPGGTSLTNGADCSGFTQSVFKQFGVSLPRNSASQREYGTGISYAEAQPGDLICYPGHVGLYIGNGYIVHASTQKTGIKISPATYRDILAVRRVI